jgi:IS605 OrfB family transposase
MTQTITVSCKLEVSPNIAPEINETLEQFADACNRILDTAQMESVTNKIKLHHLVYKPVRAATELKANHVCQAITRVVGNLKASYKIKQFRPTSILLDARTFRYEEENQVVGITLITGRKKFNLLIGNYQKGLLKGHIPTSATLVKRKNGDYYIQICVNIPTQPIGKTPKTIGVDLGRRSIAATSTGKTFTGKQLNELRDRYSRVRANVQAKCTKSSKRLLRRLSEKERRFQSWLNHNISKQLVTEAKEKNAALVFEDLTNIRQSLNRKPRSKKERRKTNNWAFYQLKQYVFYKAAIAGVQVLSVPAAYTSQTCARCHHVHPEKGKSYRSGERFNCGNCGWKHNADINAGLIISQLGLVVTQPESSVMDCILNGQLSLFPINHH